MERKKQGQTVSIWLDQDMLDRLDYISNRAGVSRSRLISNLLGVALEDAELYDKIGLFSLAIFLKDFKARFQKELGKAEVVEGVLDLV